MAILVPEILSKSICSKRVCIYSLCGHNNLTTQYKIQENSLEYILWNLVNVNDNEGCGHLSLKSLLERM